MSDLKIAGWQKLSLIDYPGKLASVIFLAGCNMCCHYCHNHHILDSTYNRINFDVILDALRRRRHWIDAVVVTGGEPTVYSKLIPLLQALKLLGLQVKLDTNGTRPSIVKNVIELGLVDYIALDLKAPVEKYKLVTGVSGDDVLQTLRYLKEQKKVSFVLRTTLSPRLELKDLVTIANTMVQDAPSWHLQQCRCSGAYLPSEVIKMVQVLKTHVPHVVVKNL